MDRLDGPTVSLDDLAIGEPYIEREGDLALLLGSLAGRRARNRTVASVRGAGRTSS